MCLAHSENPIYLSFLFSPFKLRLEQSHCACDMVAEQNTNSGTPNIATYCTKNTLKNKISNKNTLQPLVVEIYAHYNIPYQLKTLREISGSVLILEIDTFLTSNQFVFFLTMNCAIDQISLLWARRKLRIQFVAQIQQVYRNSWDIFLH